MGSVPWRALAFVALACGVVAVSVAAAAPAGERVSLSPRQARVFQEICAVCHAWPGIGVPVVGDEAEWKPRRAKGFDTLLANTVNGFGGMPPLGTCSFCSEEDLRQLVSFVAGFAEEAAAAGSAP